MNLQLRESISSVDKVLSGDAFIGYVQKNQLTFQGSKLDIGNVDYIYSYNEKIYGQDNKALYKFNSNTCQFDEILDQKANAYVIINDSSILMSKQIEGGYELLKIESGNKQWAVPYTGLYFDLIKNGCFFEKNGFKVTSFWKINLKNGVKEWCFDTNEGFIIGHKNLCVFGDVLTVIQEKINHPNKEAVLTGVDLATGKKIWEIDLDGTSKFIADNNKGKLISLFSSRREKRIYLKSVNIANGEISLSVVSENIDSDIVPWNTAIKNDLLYFSDNLGGNRLGVVSLTYDKILTQIELRLKDGVKLYEPHIVNNEIFVLDTTKTLHSLEIKV